MHIEYGLQKLGKSALGNHVTLVIDVKPSCWNVLQFGSLDISVYPQQYLHEIHDLFAVFCLLYFEKRSHRLLERDICLWFLPFLGQLFQNLIINFVTLLLHLLVDLLVRANHYLFWVVSLIIGLPPYLVHDVFDGIVLKGMMDHHCAHINWNSI